MRRLTWIVAFLSRLGNFFVVTKRHMVVMRKDELKEPFDFGDLLKDELADLDLKSYHRYKKMSEWCCIGRILRPFFVEAIKEG